MKLKPYPKYKPSGVEWLGDVPESWSVLAIKHIVSTPITDGPHETPEFVGDGIPFVSAEAISSGEIDFTKIRGYITAIDHARYAQKYKPQLGDIYMIKSGATTGVTAIVDVDVEFNIWSPLAAIRCGDGAAPRFVLNFMRSTCFQEAVALSWSFGTQQNIGMGVMENLSVAMPPLDEQLTIAAFLDRETAKIDTLIAKQEALIELLREKRQAVISHAVTKGLDPTAPMKPSGVEWLGDVPEHWEIKRLKHLSPHVTVGIVVEPSKYYCDDGVPALRSLNVRPGAISMENLVYISAEANEQLAKSKLQTGDLVAVRSGQPGTTAVVPAELDGCNCIDLIIIRKPTEMCEHFLCWYLASEPAVRQFSEGSGGAIQQHFNIGTAVNLVCAAPSVVEQTAIVSYLNKVTAQIDDLIAKAQQAIELQREHRTALISAAVTGKIDVRGLVGHDIYEEKAA